jgi:hypothetical protein
LRASRLSPNNSDREIAVFALIAAGHGTGQIAEELWQQPKTVESHCEHIKLKLGYPDAEALHCGGTALSSRAGSQRLPLQKLNAFDKDHFVGLPARDRSFRRLSARLHLEFVVILMSPDPSPKESVSLDETTDSAVMIAHSH